ncbi:porin [Paraburkholderia sp. UCT31]|uniref:porin n=1 Tax=Paraburkholderia sp. UCT31 TaxID=2615209 RepID=UPI001655F63C|nr:porin [Paraburkholderia sp. UCT31]MBC8742634.1 porin [Paraburkholderia sp. UCT31]
MKLKWVAAAAMAVIGNSAHADSSVTLYGVLDSGLLYQSTSAAVVSANPSTLTGLPPGTRLPPAAAASVANALRNLGAVYRFKDGGIYSSVWGMKGTEDLGGGYAANFRLQGSFDTGTGKNGQSDTAGVPGFFNQIATAGVNGPFGSINAGRQIAPMIYAMGETDARHAQYFGSILGAWIGLNSAAGWPGTSTNGPIGALYDSNAIVYRSPNFYGISADLEYAPGGVAGHFQGGTRESAVLKYSGYGLRLAALYYTGHDTNPFTTVSSTAATAVPATGLNNNRYWYVGALYTIKDFSVSASYSNGANPAPRSALNPNGGTSLDLYSVGLGYRFTPAFNVSSGLYYIKDRNDSKNTSLEVAAGADYSLSKSTVAYAQVGWVNNHGDMTQGITYGALVAPGMGTAAVNIGLRHNF